MIAVHNPTLPTERELMLTRALREFDPDAEVHLDDDVGKLSVSTVLDELEVIAILGGLGLEAAPKRVPGGGRDAHGSSVCGCGCGCG